MGLSRFLPLACGLLVLTAACGSPVSGDPQPTTTAGGGSTSAGAVPPVRDPLNVSKIASDTCSGLTNAQLAPFIGAIDEANSPDAQGCVWHPVDVNQPAIGLAVYPGNGGPATLGNTSFPWSASAGEIAGYPAEHMSQGGETGPQTGACETAVAVSDKDTIAIDNDDASPQNKYYTQACVLSDQVAALVIANLKAGG